MPVPVSSDPETGGGPTRTVRVLLCAEIDLITKPIQAALKRAEDIKIVATATDRVGAVSAIWRQPVDVVILDIGVGERATMMTLSRITKADAAVRLVMVASISFANIRTSMKGLMAGAAAFVPIPTQHSAHASR
ncbi:MAG: response regulator, partial [Proteobacteria bacterium]|nr:response regulator [Pseudomonadota bacterium]